MIPFLRIVDSGALETLHLMLHLSGLFGVVSAFLFHICVSLARTVFTVIERLTALYMDAYPLIQSFLPYYVFRVTGLPFLTDPVCNAKSSE